MAALDPLGDVMRRFAILAVALRLIAALGVAAAASAQQTAPASDEMATRLIERPSDAALEAYMEEQRTSAPGLVDRFEGPVGENMKIHMLASRGLMIG